MAGHGITTVQSLLGEALCIPEGARSVLTPIKFTFLWSLFTAISSDPNFLALLSFPPLAHILTASTWLYSVRALCLAGSAHPTPSSPWVQPPILPRCGDPSVLPAADLGDPTSHLPQVSTPQGRCRGDVEGQQGPAAAALGREELREWDLLQEREFSSVC